jgi:hypothetical protein
MEVSFSQAEGSNPNPDLCTEINRRCNELCNVKSRLYRKLPNAFNNSLFWTEGITSLSSFHWSDSPLNRIFGNIQRRGIQPLLL